MYKLICMAFDGDYVREGSFDSVGEAWARNEDMGSRWIFYPIRFVSDESGRVVSEPDPCYMPQGLSLEGQSLDEAAKAVASVPETDWDLVFYR